VSRLGEGPRVASVFCPFDSTPSKRLGQVPHVA
jgi:hypothetical protein